jgi:hypothetical protein
MFERNANLTFQSMLSFSAREVGLSFDQVVYFFYKSALYDMDVDKRLASHLKTISRSKAC